MELRVFWFLNKQISRLQSEEDKRMLLVNAASQSGEIAKDLQVKLATEMGQVIVTKQAFDQEGWEKLKGLQETMG